MKRQLLLSALLCAALLSPGSPASARGFRVAFVGDPQVDDALELGFARNSIYRELRERKDLDFIIFLGDLVNDKPSLLAPSKAALDSLGTPYFCVPGNHDRDVPADRIQVRDVDDYTALFGSPDTAFVRGGVHFILMNDVRLEGRAGYEGGFSVRQKEWLASVLRDIPERALTVFATHIPFNELSGADTLAAMMEGRPHLLSVSGHTHCVRRHELSLKVPRISSSYNSERHSSSDPAAVTIDELVAGATCGTWWRGPEDSHGIPVATMGCGAPRGYFVADFTRRGYRLAFKAVGEDENVQGSAKFLPDERKLLINCFGGHEDGTLEVKIGDGWRRLARVSRKAPEVEAVLAYNKSLSREQRKATGRGYMPMLNRPSPHVWELVLSAEDFGTTKKGAASGTLDIRYRDPHMSFTAKSRLL
ncbi:MAG: calcineurin-like phosphoesterase C-terminal domain-containing protein [Bacteroidales bacterium]|nr:calcineurin-like phosphoesterase C-terminal domain-containing protein [Bacteroidales bacterium]